MNLRWRIMISVLIFVVLIGVIVWLFVNQKSFGRLPQGGRLARIEQSPHYRNGEFYNQSETPLFTSKKSRFFTFCEFLFGERSNLRPKKVSSLQKTDVRRLDVQRDLIVWFGHSSYLMQLDNRRILVDPVFCVASPVSFVNKPFKGTDIYKPEDIPNVDVLIITHDHWDHLDYETIKRLNDRVGCFVCPLGVGEHLEYWGVSVDRIVEMDWGEQSMVGDSIRIHCLPSRHFSGRGLTSNKTLWASFVVSTTHRQVYVAGDGGYDARFAEIGRQFPNLDLAILENGQYNVDWQYIHLMPELMEQTVRELRPRKVLTVHHSKYALARHSWDEPLRNIAHMQTDSLPVLKAEIGEVVEL